MEHTKGELRLNRYHFPHSYIVVHQDRNDNDAYPGARKIFSVCSDMKEKGDYEANAERLVLCWNAHDALQAKADLHDELVFACGFAKAQIKKGAQKKALPMLRVALAKAKKLTGEQENET